MQNRKITVFFLGILMVGQGSRINKNRCSLLKEHRPDKLYIEFFALKQIYSHCVLRRYLENMKLTNREFQGVCRFAG